MKTNKYLSEIKKVILLTVVSLVLVSTAMGDERTENIDVFLVLDKSLSMVEEIGEVQKYVNDAIVNKLLIPGDYLLVINFYGEALIHIDKTIRNDQDKAVLRGKIGEILADGRFTDIGNALDALKQAVDTHDSGDRRRYLLLITDGIQEAPPESKYYSPDGSFNHFFLENTKTIQKKGWKIHILGIGTSSAAREIARELSGEYTQVTEEPSAEEIEQAAGELLGRIEVQGTPRISRIKKDGSFILTIPLKNEGYTEEKTVHVDAVELSIPGASAGEQEINVLTAPVSITIPVEDEITLVLPLTLKNIPEDDVPEGQIVIRFKGDTVFSPAYFELALRVPGFLSTYWWLIPVALAVLLLIGLLLSKVLSSGKAVSFNCEIEDGPVRKKHYTVKSGHSILLCSGIMGLGIHEHKTGEVVGKFHADKQGLHFQLEEAVKYTVKGAVPANILGQVLEIIKPDKKKAILRFEKE
ncbi:MAG: VWA domain-containing protein [Spirochaetales bacterium]|nr:VWA domain-containing protein [Spirochaetales bacterium]